MRRRIRYPLVQADHPRPSELHSEAAALRASFIDPQAAGTAVQPHSIVKRPLVKKAVYTAAHVSGLSRVLAMRYRGRGIIFALHSVTKDDAFHSDATLRCPVGTLDWTLRRLRQLRIDVVTLDEAVERLGARSARRFAVFTFDDGFADNLTHALPVMEKFAAPFTLYVNTGMINRDIDAWWFGVAALIRARDRIDLPGLGHFNCADCTAKQRTYVAIEAAVHAEFDLLPIVRRAIADAGIEIAAEVDREALTVQQLKKLAQHPLVTIGGHTTTHRNLARASAAAVRAEMADNKKFLEHLIGIPIAHNAYPFGHAGACGEREADISRSLGFRTAVTTRVGTLFPEHRHHLHALPRICLNRDETAATLQCKLNGFNRAITSRFGDPIARM
jgi:peptidoglycan/xylan/chitin deacetylase (PgdA/CDA1 family)